MKRDVIPGVVLAVVAVSFVALWLAAAPAEPEMKLAEPEDENSITLVNGGSLTFSAGDYITTIGRFEMMEPSRFVMAHRVDGGWWKISCVDGRSPEFKPGAVFAHEDGGSPLLEARCP